jgi:L-phenylalanine/L-methionine N-acetyltransferase
MRNQNIAIRATEPADFEAIATLQNQPRAVWGTLALPFTSAERWRQRLQEKSENVYGLSATVEGQVVGCLGLHLNATTSRRRHVAALGMSVHDDWQGRGVGSALLAAATEVAERWLNLSRLELTVYVDNVVALGLYKKFGFKVEGRLVAYAFRDGRYVDAYTMARIVSPAR